LRSLREPLVIIRDLEHRALGLGIVYLLRESASFLSSVEPVLGIVDWMFGHQIATRSCRLPPRHSSQSAQKGQFILRGEVHTRTTAYAAYVSLNEVRARAVLGQATSTISVWRIRSPMTSMRLKSAPVISTEKPVICSLDSKLLIVMTRPQFVGMRWYVTKQSARQCGVV